MPYNGASHSNLHAQLHRLSSENRRCSAALLALHASDIDCCFYRHHVVNVTQKMEVKEKGKKIVNNVGY